MQRHISYNQYLQLHNYICHLELLAHFLTSIISLPANNQNQKHYILQHPGKPLELFCKSQEDTKCHPGINFHWIKTMFALSWSQQVLFVYFGKYIHMFTLFYNFKHIISICPQIQSVSISELVFISPEVIEIRIKSYFLNF